MTAQVQELHAHSYPTLFKTNAARSDLEDAVRQYLSDDSQRALVAHSAKRGTSEVRWLIPSEQGETEAPVLQRSLNLSGERWDSLRSRRCSLHLCVTT